MATARPKQDTDNLIRWGIVALPLNGLINLVVVLTLLFSSAYYSLNVDPQVDPTGAAQSVTSTSYFIIQLLNLLSNWPGILGIIALFAYLANSRGRGWAAFAMVSSIGGICLTLPVLGVDTFVIPTIGQAYLAGYRDAFLIGIQSSGPAAAIFSLANPVCRFL